MSIKRRTGDETPRPQLGRTAKYNRWPRFVDLYNAIDKVVDYVDEKFNGSSEPQIKVESGRVVYFQSASFRSIPELENIVITYESDSIGYIVTAKTGYRIVGASYVVNASSNTSVLYGPTSYRSLEALSLDTSFQIFPRKYDDVDGTVTTDSVSLIDSNHTINFQVITEKI